MVDEQNYYREITPSGFGIAIKIKEILFSTKSQYQKIEVLDSDSSLGKILTLNDLMFVTEGDAHYYNEMITHIPMLSHKNPKNILIIGGGTGAATKEALKHESVEKIVVVDIDEVVVNTCKKYLPEIAGCLNDKKVQVEIANAFEYIKNTDNKFDVILITSPDPLGPGVGEYTSEVYQNLKKVLNEDGIVVIQSESPVANIQKSKILYTNLLKNFKIVKTYAAPVPTYPGSCWAWAFCSETTKPLDNYNEERYEKIVQNCKIFNLPYAKDSFEQETLLDDLT
jgi:spermidine synthase